MAKSSTALQAQEIRKELKQAFPNTKFSVKSHIYSMGSSIYISWTDFPIVKAVEEVVSKYSSVRYDERSGDILSGGNRFIFTEPVFSDELKAKVEKRLPLGIDKNHHAHWHWFNESLNEMYYEQLEAITEPQQPVQSNQTDSNEQAKKGYFINVSGNTFAIKDELKKANFKWYRANQVWYKSASTLDEALEILASVQCLFPTLESYITDKATLERIIINADVTISNVEQQQEVAVTQENDVEANEQAEAHEPIIIDGKIQISKIVVQRVEGPLTANFEPVECYSFAEASITLREIASTVTGHIDKTDFIIYYSDGDTYMGEYELKQEDLFRADLAQHVRDSVEFSAGVRTPSNMTIEDHESLLKWSESKEKFIHFLNNYQIGDITEPVKPSTPKKSNVIPINRSFKPQPQIINIMDSLTPEQRLKLTVLINIVGEKEMKDMLAEPDATPNVIDNLFSVTAQIMYTSK